MPCGLWEGSPTPGTGPRPVGNRTAQQEVSGGRASKTSSAAPHRSPSLALPPEPSSPTPHPWKNCFPRNQSLVPERLETAGLWHLSSLTRDRTRTLAVKVPSPNHWTARNSRDLFLKSNPQASATALTSKRSEVSQPSRALALEIHRMS